MTETGILEKKTAKRTVLRFSWEKVDGELIRSIMIAAYESHGQSNDAARARDLPDIRLPVEAERALGRPLNAKHMDSIIEVLRRDWLPTLTWEALGEFITKVQLGLPVGERTERSLTKVQRLAFLQNRRKTVNFKAQLRTLFLKMHRAPVDVGPSLVVSIPRDTGPIELRGADETDERTPFDHQQAVWTALSELERGAKPRSGLMVLPTGAGKTYTMVHWLLERMAVRADLRVLWLADRKELVDQATVTFLDLAATMPRNFSRRLRAIHSGAGLASGLADPELDVAVVTRQTMLAPTEKMVRDRLNSLLSRPTVVVVDEAHHAVAAGYDSLLTQISNTADVMLVGMTATPWPSGDGAIEQLRKRFPVSLGEVGVGELIENGVLARPVFHTVSTDVSVLLDKAELAKALGSDDLPQSVLRRLDQEGRNHSILHAWWDRREQWGKTLIFAVDIRHADTLGDLFTKQGAHVKVLHSRTTEPAVLDWFREATGPTALISVGMLTEGVDVPDARTAFLARPTSSRILMRQMIGRVLRGTVAGGDPIAHVVDLRDRWEDNVEVLSPIEIPVIPWETTKDGAAGSDDLPSIKDEAGVPIPQDVLARIIRQLNERLTGTPVNVGLIASTLTGFYELGTVNVPVFEHTAQAWNELINARLLGRKLDVRSPVDLFGDLPVPRPTPFDVRLVNEHLDSVRAAPKFIVVRTSVNIRAVAQSIIDRGALAPQERIKWITQAYEGTLASKVFPTFQAFCEAVDREALALTAPDQVPTFNPELQNGGRDREGPHRPKLRQIGDRDLKPLLQSVVVQGRMLLSQEFEYADRLHWKELPTIDWTRKPSTGLWAYWTARISGSAKGRTYIKVNSVLRAPNSDVSDELLKFLIWHELCHHLTPNQGHDAEFRRLEALWPDAHLYDHFLDDLSQNYDIKGTVAATP